jgi:alcohol dehydrogenase class IV
MAHVSLCGGLALSNSGLGAVHGLAGVIGGVTGAAHGAICGVLLPHALAANAAGVAPDSDLAARFDWVLDEIAQVYGGLTAFTDWAQGNGLPRLAIGITDRPRIAEAARMTSSMRANPVDLSIATLEKIMADAAGPFLTTIVGSKIKDV